MMIRSASGISGAMVNGALEGFRAQRGVETWRIAMKPRQPDVTEGVHGYVWAIFPGQGGAGGRSRPGYRKASRVSNGTILSHRWSRNQRKSYLTDCHTD